jgi:homoserine dehydrogenase
MTNPIKIGIAGLGTVGIGVVKIIQQNEKILQARTGRKIEIVAVSAKAKNKNRGVDLSKYQWESDPISLAKRKDIDIFVELIGGHKGAAKDSIVAAIDTGKDIVTANKALLAHSGQELAEKTEGKNKLLRFEAAVAGGIPVIKALTEGLAGNRLTRVVGVMNGTCNYILTRMQSSGLNYEEIFKEAEALGYLEADPTLDVGGIDAGHKLALLASIGFGTKVNFDAVELEGIGQISIDDINHAADMGFRIKLLGVAQLNGDGLEQRMSPCLVPATSPLGQLEGGTNMVMLEGDHVGQIILSGPGAGEGPTASAVMSDIIDIARGVRLPTFGQPANILKEIQPVKSNTYAPYYLRLSLSDKPGALAKVASLLGDFGISIDRMRQYAHADDHAPVLIVTHATEPKSIEKALANLPKTGVVHDKPVALRIEPL